VAFSLECMFRPVQGKGRPTVCRHAGNMDFRSHAVARQMTTVTHNLSFG
jgi:hypothetical protein